MLHRTLCGLLFLAVTASAQWSQIQFAPPGASYSQIVVDVPGLRLLLLGTESVTSLANPSAHSRMAIADMGAPPATATPSLTLLPGGNGNDLPHAAAVDAKGNIWIAGETDSDDFPLVNPIVAQKAAYRRTAFVMELDSKYNVLFSTYLGGAQNSALPYASRATAIALDASGNAYVGGQTDEPDFPTTPGALVAGHPGADSLNTYFSGFAVKITAAGKLAYSAVVTGGPALASAYADVRNLAVDAGGAATVAGLQFVPSGRNNVYLARLSPDGSRLAWFATPPVPFGIGDVRNLFMAQDSAGNVDLFGTYTTLLPAIQVTFGPPGLFAAQVAADGSRVNYMLDLGTSMDAGAAGMSVDANGNVYLGGTSSSAKFPAPAAGIPSVGPGFVLRLDQAGAVKQPVYRLPPGAVVAAQVVSTSQVLLVLGAHGALVTFSSVDDGVSANAVLGFANAASLEANTGIYAGALLTIYGYNLPSEVRFNGTPGTVFYARPGQINVQVPFRNYQGPVTLQGGANTLSFQPPFERSIGIFRADAAHAAALNQDGSVNSQLNPALPGSVVTLYATGAVWPEEMQDGAVATAAMPLDQERNQLQVVDGIGTPLTILYAGAAPGIINGVFQVSVQLTPGVLMPLRLLSRDPAASDGTLTGNVVQVYLRQP